MRDWRRHLPALTLVAALAGCATSSQQAMVQVFTAQPALAGATYRFERLPSQAGQPNQAELEATADALLARGGLRRNEASPSLSVQLTSSQDLGGRAGVSPSVGLGIGGGSFGSAVGIGLGFPIVGSAAPPSRRVDVVLREVASGRVVFQSQASGDSGAVALLDAALRDFPNAPPGTRTVPLGPAPAR